MSLVQLLEPHIRSFDRMVYVVSEDETIVLKTIQALYDKLGFKVQVYSPILGLQSLSLYLTNYRTKTLVADPNNLDIHKVLTTIFTSLANKEPAIYIILDPERWLKDAMVQRRILDISYQGLEDTNDTKVVFFVGSTMHVPDKLMRHIQVVHDPGMGDTEIYEMMQGFKSSQKKNSIEVSPHSYRHFKGLSAVQVFSAVRRSIALTASETKPGGSIDSAVIAKFKRDQLNKTDLISWVEPDTDFDQVAGLDLFKEWARKHKSAWSLEGQKFGLKPPKGILSIGVWGTGKSLSTKALAKHWGLPLIQLEMGRLRSSGVGESESNVYKVLRIVESVAPALLWVDEADKSFSGSASSANSDAGTTNRILGIFSSWLQETKLPVCLVMTANSAATLPTELVNRANDRFFFDLPSEDELVDLIRIHLIKFGQDPAKYDLRALAIKASRMVGREVDQSVQEAMTDSFDADHDYLDETVLANILEHKPRIFNTMSDEMQGVLDWVGWDSASGEGVRARMASSARKKRGQHGPKFGINFTRE